MLWNNNGMPMDIFEFLEENNLDFEDIIIKNEKGDIIEPTPLIKGAYLLSFDGKVLIVR